VIFDAILNREPPAPGHLNSDVPRELDAIIGKALEKDPRLRYQTASDLQADLARLKRDSSGARTAISAVSTDRVRTRRRVFGGAAVLLLVGAVAAAWSWRRTPAVPAHSTAPAQGPTMVRLTANPPERAVSGAALSPDGRYLAYSDTRGISLRLMHTNDSEVLQATKGLHVVQWFPDSARILAHEESADAFWAVSVLGRRQRLPDGLPSPDGAALVRYRDQTVSFADSGGTNWRKVVTLTGRKDLHSAPVWFPDGKRVAYAVVDHGAGAGASSVIYSLSTDGTQPVALTTPRTGTVSSVAVLPGDRVLYASQDGSSAFAIFELRPGEGSEPRALVTVPEADSIASLTPTADGRRLSYVRVAGRLDVFVAEVRDNRSLGPVRRMTLDDRMDVPTDWTPDGRVLFYSSRKGTFDIFAQAPGEDDATVLVGTPAAEGAPRVSPDGRWILYQEDSTGHTRVMRTPLEGGPSTEIVRSDRYVHHRCGRRARCILVESEGDVKVVYELDPVQGRGAELFRLSAHTGDPAMSSDGNQFAYLVDPPSGEAPGQPPVTPTIHVVDLGGRTRATLPVPGFFAVRSLDWAADGRGFYTAGYTSPNESTLLYVDLKGNVARLLGEPGSMPRWAIPSRDGRHLAIAGTAYDMNAWMIDGL
jgi:Tol biopolymer transport system component